MNFFTRTISQKTFFLSMAWRIGLFILLTIGFPFLVYGIVTASGANRVGGAGGAVAVVLGIYLKPLIYLLFCLSLFRPSMRRATSLGMTAAIGLALILLALADAGFGIVIGAHWGVAFSLGVLHLQLPYFLMAAIVAIVTMAILRDHPHATATDRFGWAYRLWLAVLLLMAAQAAVTIFSNIAFYRAGWTGGDLQSQIKLMASLQPLLALSTRQILFMMLAASSIVLIVLDRFARPPSGISAAPANAR